MKKRTGTIYIEEIGGLPAGEVKTTDDILTATKSNFRNTSTIVYTYEDLGYTPFISSISWYIKEGYTPQILPKVISETTSEIYLVNQFGGKCSGTATITFIQSNVEIETIKEDFYLPNTTTSTVELE
jgi:hypothetical protein